MSQEDIVPIAKSQKIPVNKAIKKYTIPDPEKPGAWDFKHILPCKFYDTKRKTCRIYSERPWACRIFPFLGICGTEDKTKIHAFCPGSIETSGILMTSLKEVSSDLTLNLCNEEYARLAKEFFRAALNKILRFFEV
ncbi:MAG: YkgJ family cysteine cluster protein [Methanotrichaceae archaeon]|nr:YkgJ family cysteine cluster protein [Methanotrichaceae archaeon]